MKNEKEFYRFANIVDLCALTTIALILLKLNHTINWGWLQIFSPLIVCFVVFFILFTIEIIKMPLDENTKIKFIGCIPDKEKCEKCNLKDCCGNIKEEK